MAVDYLALFYGFLVLHLKIIFLKVINLLLQFLPSSVPTRCYRQPCVLNTNVRLWKDSKLHRQTRLFFDDNNVPDKRRKLNAFHLHKKNINY